MSRKSILGLADLIPSTSRAFKAAVSKARTWLLGKQNNYSFAFDDSAKQLVALKFVRYLLVQLISHLTPSASLEMPYMQKGSHCLSLCALTGHGLTFFHLERVASLSSEFTIDSINCCVHHQLGTLLYHLHFYFRKCWATPIKIVKEEGLNKTNVL